MSTDVNTYAELTSGDHRRALTALRDNLAAHLLRADSNVAAQIAARLQSVLDAIAALPAEQGTKSLADRMREQWDTPQAS
jgi:hypothetical protein